MFYFLFSLTATRQKDFVLASLQRLLERLHYFFLGSSYLNSIGEDSCMADLTVLIDLSQDDAVNE